MEGKNKSRSPTSHVLDCSLLKIRLHILWGYITFQHLFYLRASSKLTSKVADSCRFLQIFADSCRWLQILTDSCRFLQVLADSCRFLQILADSCRFLQILADSCRFLQNLAESHRIFLNLAESYVYVRYSHYSWFPLLKPAICR